MKLYLIAGKAQTGKDTTAQYIARFCQESHLKHINLQIMYYLKHYVMQTSDWDGSEETKPRQLLQHLGTTIIRQEIDEKLFIRRIDEDIQVYSRFFDFITVSDVRLSLEIDYLKNKYPQAKTILLLRDASKTKENTQHITETDLERHENFDFVIDNNGTLSELEAKVRDIVKKDLIENEK